MNGPRSSTGLDETVAGLLCYSCGFITGIIFLVVEKESRFVKFHAMQSTVTFLGLFGVWLILAWIPIFGLLLTPLVWIVSLILWVFLMVSALRGKQYELPIAGKMASEKAGR